MRRIFLKTRLVRTSFKIAVRTGLETGLVKQAKHYYVYYSFNGYNGYYGYYGYFGYFGYHGDYGPQEEFC
jgi:hypothetical protein